MAVVRVTQRKQQQNTRGRKTNANAARVHTCKVENENTGQVLSLSKCIGILSTFVFPCFAENRRALRSNPRHASTHIHNQSSANRTELQQNKPHSMPKNTFHTYSQSFVRNTRHNSIGVCSINTNSPHALFAKAIRNIYNVSLVYPKEAVRGDKGQQKRYRETCRVLSPGQLPQFRSLRERPRCYNTRHSLKHTRETEIIVCSSTQVLQQQGTTNLTNVSILGYDAYRTKCSPARPCGRELRQSFT